MEGLVDLMVYLPVISLLEVFAAIFSLLFMHYSAKFRNHKLSVGWYVCGVLFGIWTVIIFLIKRKDFPGPEAKICLQCGKSYPEGFEECPRCSIGLPLINPDEKKKQKKLSRGFGVAIIITYLAALVVGIFIGMNAGDIIDDDMSLLDVDDRIAVNGVFYDKMGNSYEDEESVLLYDEDGRTYTYSAEDYEDEEYGLGYYEEFYVRDDGEKYFIYDCYVTEDGWFYCDKACVLEVYPDTASMSEKELDAYYNALVEYYGEKYKYYDYPYTDEAGNLYYCAYEASWNENGELITAENDAE